jgi:hypothetical protein
MAIYQRIPCHYTFLRWACASTCPQKKSLTVAALSAES